jgi:hypothetical protein
MLFMSSALIGRIECLLYEFCTLTPSQKYVARGSALLGLRSAAQRSRSNGAAVSRLQSMLRASLAATFSTSAPSAGASTAPAATSSGAAKDTAGSVEVAEAVEALKRLQDDVSEYRAAVKMLETRIDKIEEELDAVSVKLAVPGLDPVKKASLRAEKESLRAEQESLRADKLLVLRKIRDEEKRLDFVRAAGKCGFLPSRPLRFISPLFLDYMSILRYRGFHFSRNFLLFFLLHFVNHSNRARQLTVGPASAPGRYSIQGNRGGVCPASAPVQHVESRRCHSRSFRCHSSLLGRRLGAL